jgi:hypothetical protein
MTMRLNVAVVVELPTVSRRPPGVVWNVRTTTCGSSPTLTLSVKPPESVAVRVSSRYDGYSWSGAVNGARAGCVCNGEHTWNKGASTSLRRPGFGTSSGAFARGPVAGASGGLRVVPSPLAREDGWDGPIARWLERPRGALRAETENPARLREPGSNMRLLVGEAGFEPAASCTQSRCASAALLPGGREPTQEAPNGLRTCQPIFVQVPHLLVMNPTSVGRMSTTAWPVGLSLAMMPSIVWEKSFVRAQ